MRGSKDSEKAPQDRDAPTAEKDAFPTGPEAFRRLVQDERFPDSPLQYLEIHAQANGDVSYRLKEARSDEFFGGIAPAE